MVAGSEDAICHGGVRRHRVAEAVIIDALDLAHKHIKTLIAVQRDFVAELGHRQGGVRCRSADPWPEDFVDAVKQQWREPLREALHVRGKFEQRDAAKAVRTQAIEALGEDVRDEQTPWVKAIFRSMLKEITRETILDKRERLDGRAFDEIRPVSCETGLLPRTHGSALFTRGETQALVTCTLGTSEDSQVIEAFEGESRRDFLLHYNFPPFSVGEARFLRGPGRREIGHGTWPTAPSRRCCRPRDEFPYTMRVVSDILESNGSSSMATVCGGSMALMDAGVPMGAPVAGVAMGLVSDGERFAVLTDIAGQEDHYGDMDFKVAGSRKGITALQMDIKVEGLPRENHGAGSRAGQPRPESVARLHGRGDHRGT